MPLDQKILDKDLYAVLGVESDATDDEIKKARGILCLKWHPDKAGATPENHEKFVAIQEAWEVLKDPVKRSEYTNRSVAYKQTNAGTEKAESDPTDETYECVGEAFRIREAVRGAKWVVSCGRIALTGIRTNLTIVTYLLPRVGLANRWTSLLAEIQDTIDRTAKFRNDLQALLQAHGFEYWVSYPDDLLRLSGDAEYLETMNGRMMTVSSKSRDILMDMLVNPEQNQGPPSPFLEWQLKIWANPMAGN
ncbi:hypothetical protein F4677DRAFT_458306 [Hypoxylon crocopeplum]|nr:hypothetical protein F4677DRAFT_458306 [Hypoxylon crocopeplum]